ALMVALLARHNAIAPDRYLQPLRKEHAYWMDGASDLRPGAAHRRVVRLPSGAILNRYWDDRDTPREESFSEDVTTARGAARDASAIYRDLRAAAESGWDFSSRLLAEDSVELSSICTT